MKVSINVSQNGGMFLGVLGVEKAVGDLLSSGFEPPIHFAVMGVNGATMVGRFDRDVEQGDTITSMITYVECPSGSFSNPIHVLFLDQRGYARHITP